MVDILKAMATAAAVLLPIVILTLIVSMATFNRGVAAMRGDVHDIPVPAVIVVPGVAAAIPAAGKKAAAGASADPSIGEILLLGSVLFVLAVLVLFGISLVSHMA